MAVNTSRNDAHSRQVAMTGAVLAAVVFSQAASRPHGFWLSWFGLLLWTLSLYRVRSDYQVGRIGAIFGGLYFAIQFDFIRTVGSVGNWYGNGAYAFEWLMMTAAGAALWTCNALVVAGGRRRDLPAAVLLPVSICVSEIVSDILARHFLGTTGCLSRLALRQVDCGWLLQSADIGGELLVSWGAATVVGIGVDFLMLAFCESSRSSRKIGLLAAIELLPMFLYGTCCLRFQPRESEQVQFVLVPRMFHREDATEIKGALELGQPRPICCIWPEMAISADSYEFTNDRRSLIEMSLTLNCSVLVGATRLDHETVGPFNSALLLHVQNDVLQYVDKRFLTPALENNVPVMQLIPGRAAPSFSPPFVGGGAPRKTLSLSARAFKKGEDSDARRSVVMQIGVGICHDICFPEWGVDWIRVNPRMDLLVQLANETTEWSWRAQPLLLAAARLRAVEARRPLVRSVLGGYSGLIDSSGRVLHVIGQRSCDQILYTGLIPLSTRDSWYATRGPLPAVSVVFTLSLFQLWLALRERRGRTLTMRMAGESI